MPRSDCPPLDQHAVNSMKANKRKDTKPELMVRKALREAGFPGYRLQWKVAGRPDICYPGRKIAIFVNGCFWHRCPYCNPSVPKHNRSFWEEKFNSNVERDQHNIKELTDEGWSVHILWECQIKKNLDGVIGEVVADIRRGGDERDHINPTDA